MLKIKNNLGQIFLKNKKKIQRIIHFIKPKKKDNLLEIGYGNGELTNNIIKFNKNLTSLEIDNYLIKKNKKKNENIKIINIDILKFNLLNFFKKKKKKKIRIFGNIPYSISKKIILKCIKNIKIIKDIHILIQKELLNSLIKNKKRKKYGKWNILINYIFKVKLLMKIKKKYFYPKPKVDSVLIKLKPKKNKFKIKKLKYFIYILKNSFKRKNKKIINNLKQIINKNILNQLNIDLNKRPQKISIKEFCQLTKLYYKIIKKKL